MEAKGMADPMHEQRARNVMSEVAKGLGLVLILILLMMWLAGSFVSKVGPAPPAPKPPPPELATQRVEMRMLPLLVDQVGTLRAQTLAEVSSRVMAQVREIFVRPGDKVLGGENGKESATIMGRLDDRDIRARLRQAESQVQAMDRAREAARARLKSFKSQVEAARANRDKAVADYDRYQELYRNHAATGLQLDQYRAQKTVSEARLNAAQSAVQSAQGELERIQAQKKEAEAAVAQARVMLSYTEIRAPFSGVVVQKKIDVGDMATPGLPLFVVQTTSKPQLLCYIPETFVPGLKVGQKMNVQIDSLHRTFPGEITEIEPKADPSTRTVLVKVSLSPYPDLVSGLYGKLQVPRGTYRVLVIPEKALREIGQLYLVDVLTPEGYTERRFVTTGERLDGMVEILSGLKENEEVVIP
jgi:multidrug resistance efflux pump